eukprot:1200162-Pyramimonas_sp.AAC.1
MHIGCAPEARMRVDADRSLAGRPITDFRHAMSIVCWLFQHSQAAALDRDHFRPTGRGAWCRTGSPTDEPLRAMGYGTI